MPKRVLDCSPLVMSLVEVRFSDVPESILTAEIESFRAALFELGLSIFNEDDHDEYELNHQQSRQLTVKKHSSKRWDFLNLKRNASVTLTKNQLMYRTTNYQTFEEFRKIWESVLNAYFIVFPSVQKAGLKRIGLRYMDLFMGEPGDNIYEYINPSFLSKVQMDSKSESVNSVRRLTRTDVGFLKLELEERIPSDGTVNIFPTGISDPDAVALTVPLRPHWKVYEGSRYAVVDIDHFWQASDELEPVESERILKTLENLYKDSSDTFWSLLTDYAQEKWKLKEVK